MIAVVEYDPQWPLLFQDEALSIKKAMKDNCLALHHIGSTAVPGLCAKPIIDIMAVVQDVNQSICDLEKTGFEYKGEYNIPFKHVFQKQSVHLHVMEQGHPEIELQLFFKDTLMGNKELSEEYGEIKKKLCADPSASLKPEGMIFSKYTLGKDAFIRRILEKGGYQGVRFLKTTHYQEWEEYHRISKNSCLTNHPDHHHFILYQGVNVVTVAHAELLSEKNEAIIHFIATDTSFHGNGYDNTMMKNVKRWLANKGVKTLRKYDIQDEVFI